MIDAFGVEISKGLPSYLRGAVKESDAVGGTNLKLDYMRRRVSAHYLGRQASKYGSVTGKGSALSTGKAMRTRSRKKLIAINNISKGMPKSARAIGNDLLRNPEHNFAPFSEIISPKKTNYVVLRHNSYRRGRESAKTYAKLKQDPLKPDPYGLTPATRTTINRDFGRNSKLGFGPQDIASGHLHRFTGVTKPADVGGKTGWKAMLDENNAKKLPNINRDNYISQRPKASQDKLRAFIKRRDRKARGEIYKGMPRAARAFASKLNNHPDTNFAAAHETLNPRDTNYIVFRSVSHSFGRNAAKFASNKKKTPSIAANSREQNKIYSQSMIDDGKAYKRSVAPLDAYSAKNKHAFEGAGGFGGYHGWKPMLDKSSSLKKLPNVTRDNYISQRPAASQAKLKNFIKRRDRKARGEISKSGVGAGRYMRAIDMPAKIRTRQLARLIEKKPQVASVQDQIFAGVRDELKLRDFNSTLGIPKNKGTVLNVGRKKHKVLIHNNKRMKNGGVSGITIPNPRDNTNHIVVPNKLKTTGKKANTIEHEKVHAQVSPQRIIRNGFRKRNAKFGEEARADAIANLKTGRRTVTSAYPTANNRRYTEVYTMITGRKPKMAKIPKSERTSPSKQKKIDDQTGRSINAGFSLRSPGPEYQSARKPNLP